MAANTPKNALLGSATGWAILLGAIVASLFAWSSLRDSVSHPPVRAIFWYGLTGLALGVAGFVAVWTIVRRYNSAAKMACAEATPGGVKMTFTGFTIIIPWPAINGYREVQDYLIIRRNDRLYYHIHLPSMTSDAKRDELVAAVQRRATALAMEEIDER